MRFSITLNSKYGARFEYHLLKDNELINLPFALSRSLGERQIQSVIPCQSAPGTTKLTTNGLLK